MTHDTLVRLVSVAGLLTLLAALAVALGPVKFPAFLITAVTAVGITFSLAKMTDGGWW